MAATLIKTVIGERREVRYTTRYDPVTRRTIAVPYYITVPIYGMKQIYTAPKKPGAPIASATPGSGGGSSVSSGSTSSLGSWGQDLVFTVNDSKILTFDKLQRTITGRWGSHSRLGKKDQTEFLGPGLQKMTFSITLSAMYGVKPRAMLEAIEKAVESGTVNPFVVGGKRIGSGQWKITSATEAWDVVWRQGELVKATLDITMEEYE